MSWKKKVALGFAALLALIFLFLVVEHVRGRWGLARWKSRMAAKGEPLTITAVAAPPARAGQDGMPAVTAAALQVGRFPWELRPPTAMYAAPGKVIVITAMAEWPGERRHGTNITWQFVSEALQKRADAVAAAVKALENSNFNDRLDYYAGWSLRLPHFPQFYHLSRWLCAAALDDLRRGDFDRSTGFLEAAIRLAGTLKNERLVLSQLVRIMVAQHAFDSTWQAVFTEGLQDAHLKRLQEAWAKQDFLQPMRAALSMEHVMISHEFDRFRNGDAPMDKWVHLGGGPTPPPIAMNSPIHLLVGMIEHAPEFFRNGVYTPIWKFGWSYQDELQSVKTVERGLKAWEVAIAQQSVGPVSHFTGEYLSIEEDPVDLRQNFYDSMRYVIAPRAGRFYPSMKQAFSMQTLRELTMTGLALQRYKLRYGKLPEKLDDLVPDFLPTLPHDFMDGQPLKYRQPVLYSVGLDGQDDGGDVGTDVVRGFNILRGKDFVWPRPASSEEVISRLQLSP